MLWWLLRRRRLIRLWRHWVIDIPILGFDFFFSSAICFRRRALRGPAVPLTLPHFVQRACVSATSFTGTSTTGSSNDFSRAECSQMVQVHSQNHLQTHPDRNLHRKVCQRR